MKEELEKLYNKNLARGMNPDDAYTNRYPDAEIDHFLDGRGV